MKPIIFIGGDKHGEILNVEDQKRVLNLAVPSEMPARINELFGPRLVIEEYALRTYGIEGTRRHMSYMVLRTMSDDEALPLIEEYEAQ